MNDIQTVVDHRNFILYHYLVQYVSAYRVLLFKNTLGKILEYNI
jgi:hypothetical protein